MKRYVDTFLVIIGLLIIIGTVICYLFYNLNSTTMYAYKCQLKNVQF